jgi:hypothetical protein
LKNNDKNEKTMDSQEKQWIFKWIRPDQGMKNFTFCIETKT